MKKLLSALLLWALCLPAIAADNAVTLTTGSGVTMRTTDVGAGVQSSNVILSSITGTAIYGTAGTANANVLTVQGVTSMTPLLTTLSGTNNIATVTTVTGVTTVSTVTNLSQMNGAALLMGNGVTGTGSQRVTIASDNTAFSVNAVGSGVSSGADAVSNTATGTQIYSRPSMFNGSTWDRILGDTTNGLWVNVKASVGAAAGSAPTTFSPLGALTSGATGGLNQPIRQCDSHTFYTGSDNGSKTLVAGVSGRKTYICGWVFATGATATTLTMYKGTDADCVTAGAAIGPPYLLVANDKIGANTAFWNGFVTATNADYVCINASAGNAHTAEIWYTIQ